MWNYRSLFVSAGVLAAASPGIHAADKPSKPNIIFYWCPLKLSSNIKN